MSTSHIAGFRHALARCTLAISALALAPPVFAALGGPPTLTNVSPQAIAQVNTRTQLIARLAGRPVMPSGTASAPWTARETTLPGGTLEREYVGADGLIFAVAWRGPWRPSLSTLLGHDYAVQMAQQASVQQQNGQGSRRQTSQNSATFCVHAITLQHFSEGVAWLPPKLPAGVNADALGISPGA